MFNKDVFVELNLVQCEFERESKRFENLTALNYFKKVRLNRFIMFKLKTDKRKKSSNYRTGRIVYKDENKFIISEKLKNRIQMTTISLSDVVDNTFVEFKEDNIDNKK